MQKLIFLANSKFSIAGRLVWIEQKTINRKENFCTSYYLWSLWKQNITRIKPMSSYFISKFLPFQTVTAILLEKVSKKTPKSPLKKILQNKLDLQMFPPPSTMVQAIFVSFSWSFGMTEL